MSESREDPIEFLTAAEAGRASPAAERLATTRRALPRIFAAPERCPREPASGHGRRLVPDGGRPLSRVAVSGLSRMNPGPAGKAMRAAPAPRLRRSGVDSLQ